MATTSFWLTFWEYECCVPPRKVGDEVEVKVFPTPTGTLWEYRHLDTPEPPSQVIKGTIETIRWYPQVLEPLDEDGRRWRVVGRGSPIEISDTEKTPTRLEGLSSPDDGYDLEFVVSIPA